MSIELVDIPGTKDRTRRKEIPGEKTWKVKTAKTEPQMASENLFVN